MRNVKVVQKLWCLSTVYFSTYNALRGMLLNISAKFNLKMVTCGKNLSVIGCQYAHVAWHMRISCCIWRFWSFVVWALLPWQARGLPWGSNLNATHYFTVLCRTLVHCVVHNSLLYSSIIAPSKYKSQARICQIVLIYIFLLVSSAELKMK